MIINHNMNAFISHGNLVKATKKSGTSMKKLSSGLRINKASDDAAGLAISEKMRAQIRGLNQESRNAQDGISLIQTAEGALNETHSLLQRMRELSVQAANDTNDVEDTVQIQREINQLTSEINRIGNTTEFNTMKILDKSPAAPLDVKLKFIKEMKSGWLESTEKLIKSTYGITGKDSLNKGEVFVNYYYNTGKGGKPVMGEVDEGRIILNVDLKNFYSDKLDDVDRGRAIAKEFTRAVLIDNLHSKVMIDAPEAFINGLADLVIGDDSVVKNLVKDNSADGYNIPEVNKIAKHAVALLKGEVEWGSQKMYKYDEAAAYSIIQCIAQNTKVDHHDTSTIDHIFNINPSELGGLKYTKSNMSNFMKDFNDIKTIAEKRGTENVGFSDSLEYAIIKNTKYISIDQLTLCMNQQPALSSARIANVDGDLAYFILDQGTYSSSYIGGDVGGIDTKKLGMKIDWKSNSEADEGAYIGSNFGNAAVRREDTITKTSLREQPLATYKTEFADPYKDPSVLHLEVGGQIGIQLQDMRARALDLERNEGKTITLDNGTKAYYTSISSFNGVTDGTNGKVTGHALDVGNHEKAEAAISVIDDAIKQVSAQRSVFGALQNRLEHSISNLNNAAENLTSAESRIRDVDMAKEMMILSKENILQQVTQTMLAQAKSQPQGVLQLLS